MGGENATGAVNQQERLDAYFAGYVDGEGTFHVAIQRNSSTRVGWQLVPEFHVTQVPERRQVLDLIQLRLGCGRIQENHRTKKNDTTLVLVVRKRTDLLTKVIPFFESQPLLSSKHEDFLTFAAIVRAMDRGEHLETEGFARLCDVALGMNGGGKYRRVHRDTTASRILRDHMPNTAKAVKIWSDLHGDMQSQAEMTWPAGESAGE
jgi:LAGLIDADG DNA endonuclease family protein